MQDNIPSWDLNDLFVSIEDPKIDELIEKTKLRAQNFKEKYRNSLQKYLGAAELLEALKEYESILSDTILPQIYAELLSTTDTQSSQIGAFLQQTRMVSTEIFENLIFFEIELAQISEKQFQDLIENKQLENYKHFFEKLLANKKHQLKEEEEKVFQYKDLTSKQAFARLFEKELASQKFKIEIEGQAKELTQAEILNLLYVSSDQKLRAKAAKIFTQQLLEKESVLTFVTNTLAEDKKISDKLRKFSFPEEERHLSNEAKPESVEIMCQVVEQNYKLVQKYYDFKKQILNVDQLYDYDRYAPFKAASQKYTFVEAKEIVLEAFGEFDQEFARIAQEFFEKHWIDAEPKEGKNSGAYCEGATPAMHPYVFMNFTGSANDVMTLAHELGHAIHFELARKQTYLNYHAPLTLSETASIFAETLVFAKLASNIQDKEILLGLYMKRIEGIIASIQRQISMYRFEQKLHSTYRAKGELSQTEINALWRSTQEVMFGESVELTEDYDNWWMYVPHFIRTPFYVYAYAFGEMLAFGLFEKARDNREEFFKQYKQFLSAGCSKSPSELANIFGINLDSEQFWQQGMKIFEQYIEKAIELGAK